MKSWSLVVAALAFASAADAIPVKYEFSGTIDRVELNSLDPAPPDLVAAFSALLGQPIFGTFAYDDEVPLSFQATPAFGSLYDGAIADLVATVAGDAVISTHAYARIGDRSAQDFLFLASSLDAITGEVLGATVGGFEIYWQEGSPTSAPAGDFLTSELLPAELPTEARPQVLMGLQFPNLPQLIIAVAAEATTSVRRVQVSEPTTMPLFLLGGLAALLTRRRLGRSIPSLLLFAGIAVFVSRRRRAPQQIPNGLAVPAS